MKDDRARWRVHVEPEPWAALPLGSVTRAMAREWLSHLHAKGSSNPTHKSARRAKPLAVQTIKNILNLVRRAFQDASDEGLCDSNPFDGLKVRKSRHARTSEAWTVLTLEEQQRAILALGDLPERLLVQFALGSGLRQGEQWALRLADVDATSSSPHALVRFGGSGAVPTKNGKPRRVPLFGVALAALREWLSLLPRYAPSNPSGLVFPRTDGKQRRKGRAFRAWSRVAQTVGRPVRWHDLRHTCASSLVGGWWGPAWSLEEVRVLLGHSSIAVTERYAHFAADRLNRAAARTGLTHEDPSDGGALRLLLDRGAPAIGESASRGTAGGDGAGVQGVFSATDDVSSAVRLLAGSGDESEGVIGMVDGVNGNEVETSPRLADEATPVGRFSSVVEQRFRKPEPPSEAKKEPEAAKPAKDAKDAPSAFLGIATVVAERRKALLERDEAWRALNDVIKECEAARAALDLAERERDEARDALELRTAEVRALRRRLALEPKLPRSAEEAAAGVVREQAEKAGIAVLWNGATPWSWLVIGTEEPKTICERCTVGWRRGGRAAGLRSTAPEAGSPAPHASACSGSACTGEHHGRCAAYVALDEERGFVPRDEHLTEEAAELARKLRALEARHREAIGLLTDLERFLIAARSFLDREAKS